jgi:hypothetical protein
MENENENENSDDFIRLSNRQNRIKNFLLNFKIVDKMDSMECLRGILSINKHFRTISYTAELYYLVMFKMLMEDCDSKISRIRLGVLIDKNPELEEFRPTDDDMEIYKKVSLETLYTNRIYNLGI